MMRNRFTKIVAGLAALAALALGGATLASAGGSPSTPSPAPRNVARGSRRPQGAHERVAAGTGVRSRRAEVERAGAVGVGWCGVPATD